LVACRKCGGPLAAPGPFARWSPSKNSRHWRRLRPFRSRLPSLPPPGALSRIPQAARGGRARSTEKELDPDFVDFNSVNRRYHFPARFYTPFRAAFGQIDPILLMKLLGQSQPKDSLLGPMCVLIPSTSNPQFENAPRTIEILLSSSRGLAPRTSIWPAVDLELRGSVDLYSYVKHAPTMMVDPTGEEVVTLAFAVWSIGKTLSHCILSWLYCGYCDECTERASRQLSDWYKKYHQVDPPPGGGCRARSVQRYAQNVVGISFRQ
jgi:hypothetical protein